MSTLTEGRHLLEFLVSEAPGYGSRDTVSLASGQNLEAGSVVGIIEATGLYTVLAPAATNGAQIAAGILCDNVDASAADKECVVIARNAEVKEPAAATYIGIKWPAGITDPQKATARAELLARGIVVRS